MPVTHTFSLVGERLPPSSRVVGFRGQEGISRPYRVEVFLLLSESDATRLDPRSLLGARASLKINNDHLVVRRAVHGAWSSVSLVRAVQGGDALYRCVLSPLLWRLSLTRRSRIFVDKTLPQIVESMLRAAGFTDRDFLFQLENPARYLPIEHACQYRESDLDFLSRRLEHEGVYFYFQHPRDGAAERLVISDSRSFAAPYETAPVNFLATDTPGSATEGLRSIECEYAAVPTNARTYGYNPINPDLRVFGEALDGSSSGTVSTWEPARNETEGRRYAAVRADELRAQQAVLLAQGRVFGACAGHTTRLQGHSLLDGEYLVTDSNFQGSNMTAFRELATTLKLGVEVFDVTFKAIDARVQFRPQRVTPRPQVHGFELGVVKGPLQNSSYAQLDAQGRYLVRMMFDEDTAKPAPSARLRMLQPHGGAGMGFHFPLRDGTEVLVSFLGGDPDAPVIAGVAPNGQMPSPVDSTNATKNVLQTGGGSRLEIEDQQNAQAVDWSTPYKNTRFHLGAAAGAAKYEIAHTTEGSGLVDVGGRWDTKIGGDRSEAVRGGQDTTVYKDLREELRGDHQSSVAGRRAETIHGNHDYDAKANVIQTVGGDITQVVTGKWSLTAADKVETIASASSVNRGATHSVYGGAKFDLFAGAQMALNIGEKLEINVGAKQDFCLANLTAINVGAKQELNASLNLVVNLAGTVEIGAGIAASTFTGLTFENRNGLYMGMTTGLKMELHVGPKMEDHKLTTEFGSLGIVGKTLAIFL